MTFPPSVDTSFDCRTITFTCLSAFARLSARPHLPEAVNPKGFELLVEKNRDAGMLCQEVCELFPVGGGLSENQRSLSIEGILTSRSGVFKVPLA